MRSCILITAFGLLSGAARLQAQTGGDKIFAGDGRTDWGGPIGKATLEISDDTTNLSGKLTVTQGNTGGNVLVLYLQTGTNGGFANTSGFADANDGIRQAISGYSGSQRSTLTFLAGFRPAYAVGIQPGTFGGLWSLANGGGNSLPFITSVNLNPSSTSPAVYTFNFSLANVGLTNGPAVVGKTIKILGTFISNTGYRSPESIAGDTDGTTGYAPTAQTAFVTYTVGTIPTVTYPVTFQVDMGNCIANSLFNPGSDTVIASGSFNASDLSFALTPSANPNIYTATFNDSNTLGTIETYKFTILPGAGGSLPEATDARSFTLTNTQTLPLVYFSDFAPATNATAPLTFSVNMGPETFAGNFNPANGDTVYAYGVFDQNAALAWAPTTALTPSTTNTNVYVGTIGDGNYPGTFGQYKFVYHSNTKGQYIYESTPNRDYFTPATSNSFPTVFFNNASNAVLVSFNVDMSTEIQFSR
ncbi:MAG: Por secretion system C-terminal sorting protein, partial [Pedosphaera sp.]|nr:Por secretion system C-terminal sorting protein [Pedosphaera sp.]